MLRCLEVLASAHPALSCLMDPQVLGVWQHRLSRRGWERADRFWDGVPVYDDGQRVDGYRLGDTYQALSADARKRALCQTPCGWPICCWISPLSRQSRKPVPIRCE